MHSLIYRVRRRTGQTALRGEFADKYGTESTLYQQREIVAFKRAKPTQPFRGRDLTPGNVDRVTVALHSYSALNCCANVAPSEVSRR